MINRQVCKRNSKTERDLFSNLPPEIMIDIFSRLPIRSIGRCKCVSKSWFDLVKSDEFVNSHSSKSIPCLAFYDANKSYKVLELVDTQGSRRDCNVVFINFDFPPAGGHARVCSSVNGLLFLLNIKFQSFLICNPITSEYIKLPPPPSPVEVDTQINTYGFGVSKLSGKYKVVRMFYPINGGDVTELSPWKCEVYTLGTGSWRRIEAGFLPNTESFCLFFNGNLHWFVRDEGRRDRRWILCFDLETECVTSFSTPHFVGGHRILCALGDYGLCVCDISHHDIVIWSMNEYGDDKSWRKEFVIKKQRPLVTLVLPVKIFNDGDILFAFRYHSARACWYSSKTKTSREIDLAQLIAGRRSSSIVYTPSFVSLKTLTTVENVCSL